MAHQSVLDGCLVLLHALAGAFLQALLHQLLAIHRRLPGAPEAIHQLGVFGLLLPVQIQQFAANLHHPGKVRTVFRTQLRLFQLQFAAARVNLLQESGRKAAAFDLQLGIGGDYQFRVALGSGAVFGFAQNAIGRCAYQLPAQLVDLQQDRAVLCLALLAIGQRLRGAQQAVLVLESRQSLLILLHTGLQLLELALQPG